MGVEQRLHYDPITCNIYTYEKWNRSPQTYSIFDANAFFVTAKMPVELGRLIDRILGMLPHSNIGLVILFWLF
jgi:hypothetical protein